MFGFCSSSGYLRKTGEATAQTSMRLSAFLAGLCRLPDQSIAQLDHALRTAAHFIGFFIMSALVFSAVRCTWTKSSKVFGWTLPVCCAIAVADEVKKFLITGRHFSLMETALNLAGVGCGLWLMAYGFGRKQKARNVTDGE